MWIIDINGEEPITAQGALDEINFHPNSSWKIQGQDYSMHNEDLPENRY